ncbi:hypothetical protein HPB49_010321 [Dermacentor silvarum]|uniref:Uncharacterized protein n=1 Tax=Dermacentor silvarum TaxID=543639 RepID=A0ACB8DZ43_DERSI|nr:hypothetical protein HPB49_010321 [Dermacentor silvarum]
MLTRRFKMHLIGGRLDNTLAVQGSSTESASLCVERGHRLPDVEVCVVALDRADLALTIIPTNDIDVLAKSDGSCMCESGQDWILETAFFCVG